MTRDQEVAAFVFADGVVCLDVVLDFWLDEVGLRLGEDQNDDIWADEWAVDGAAELSNLELDGATEERGVSMLEDQYKEIEDLTGAELGVEGLGDGRFDDEL